MSTKLKNILIGIIIVILVLAVFISGCISNRSVPANDSCVVEFNASGDRNMTSIFGINISPRKSGVSLPDPTHTGNSVELCLNSRVSYHEEWRGKAPDEWPAQVLWAAGRAPVTGSYRDIYVTLPHGSYLYDPAAHSLTNRKSGRSGDAAFLLSFDRDLDFDAGAAYMFATLASVSLWNGTQIPACELSHPGESLFRHT
jgi:hypothetical protein